MILLDTHVLIWAVSGSARRIGPRTTRLISRAPIRYVSAITHAEMAVKGERLGVRLPADLPDLLTQAGFTALPFEARHAAGVRDLTALDRHDPFDRMLVAQAEVDGLTFVTADSTLLDLEMSWIQDATE